jgi:superfamily I DNA/RNA helicase
VTTTLTPTPEQEAVLDAYLCGNRLVVDALAGSGKTSTLRMLATATPRRGGLYIAYNKAIATDAEKSFPSNTMCRTAHSLAYQAVGYLLADKLKKPRQRATDVARILGIDQRFLTVNITGDAVAIDRAALARMVLDTVERFSHSADFGFERWHVKRVTGLGEDGQAEVDERVLHFARRAWVDLCSHDGKLRLAHDHYLKLWQLLNPTIPTSVIYLDEAQDANPVIADIVGSQDHAQLILVGDRHQQLYGWRGATDAMTTFDGTRLALTKSFRFGPAIAEVANEWLEQLGSNLRVVGHDPIPSTVGRIPYDEVSAILCRTNAGTIAQAIAAEDRGRRAAITGGTGDLAALARAAQELQDRGTTSHPEFMAFKSWSDVVEHAESEAAGENLATFVRLVVAYGPAELLRIINSLQASEDSADLVISTGHKAKGREWDRVLIGPDFKPFPRKDPETGKPTPPVMTDEARMLAYVAVTRAKLRLDPAGLDWATEAPAALAGVAL